MADEKYWTCRSAILKRSNFDEVSENIFKGKECDWIKLSPGMRREIVRGKKNMWTTIVSLDDIPKALKRQAEMFCYFIKQKMMLHGRRLQKILYGFADILQEDIVGM